MADEAGKREGGEDEGLPEVEAELVSETPPVEGAFDAEEAPKAAPEAELEPDAPAGDGGGPAGKPPLTKSLTPGVMLFGAFAVVALAAFGVWRVLPRAEPGPSPISAEESPAATTAEPDQAATDAATPTKIDNAPADAAEAMMKRAPETGAPEGEITALPPVTEAGASKLGNVADDGVKQAAADDPEEGVSLEIEPDAGEAPEIDPSTAESAIPVLDEEPPVEETPASAPSGDEADGPAAGPAVEPDTAPAQDEPASVGEADTGPVATEMAPPDEAFAPAPADSIAADSIANAENVQSLEQELAKVRASFSEQQRQLATALANEHRTNLELKNEVERLRTALSAAEAARDEAANEEITALRAEVQKLRREQANTSARQMRASFALAALARAVDQGGPYTEELAAVAEFEPAAAAALEVHAETGVPSDAALRDGFDAAARSALAAAGQEKAGGGFAGLIARAQSLVSVRPAAPMNGDGPGAVLSRAEAALDQGEITFALLQLEDLPLSAQEAMADWMADARRRAEAEAGLARLEAALTGEAG